MLHNNLAPTNQWGSNGKLEEANRSLRRHDRGKSCLIAFMQRLVSSTQKPPAISHGRRLIEALPNRDVARVKGSAILDAEVVCLDHNGVADLKLCTAAVCKLGLEGIVSKKLNAPYRSGPSKTWIKVRNPKAPAATRAIDGAFSLRCEMSDSGKWLFNLADLRWDICAANPRTSCDLADS